MRVVTGSELASLPSPTVYSRTDGEAVGPFPGYGESLEVTTGEGDPSVPAWQAAELIAQPLSDGNGTPRRLAVRLRYMRRECEDSERFYVYEAEELALLIGVFEGARDALR